MSANSNINLIVFINKFYHNSKEKSNYLPKYIKKYLHFYIKRQQKQARIAQATLQINAIGIVSSVFFTLVEAK